MRSLTFLTILCLCWTLVLGKKCQDMTIPIQISANNGVFNVAIPQTDSDVTNFALVSARQGSNYSQSVLGGYHSVSGTYQISATHCAPDNGEGDVVQILTHGIGFDKSYWNLPFTNYDYSYVTTAVDKYGYSTLTWDRLGIANSSHGDPLSEIQAPLEQAALAALSQLARNHNLPNGASGFSKIIHVGHSYGSILSFAVARDDPSASDGLILQSWAMNQTFFSDFTYGANLIPTAGYLAAGNAAALQAVFFAPGQFDPAMLTYAYAHGQPATIGEPLTIGGALYGSSDITGPVMVITGEHDIPFCGGDCYATGDSTGDSIPDASKQVFPKASTVNVTIVPGGGYVLNMEYNHAHVFEQMNDFLAKNGLAANGGK